MIQDADWGVPAVVSFYDEATAAVLKLKFAEALSRNPHNSYQAALEIEPDNGRATWISNHWTADPVVITHQAARTAAMGAIAGLPSKEELALKIYRASDDVKDPSTKLAYFRAVADVMGYIAKGGTNVNVQTNVNMMPKVQRVPVFATDADWEAKAKMVEERLAATAG
jgi:hypothetical protein